ncbi:MAG TPA: hypothetical protein VEA69_11925 [Tepidisphaeraceae bacterium]|nr:hypothetical protein [Tepidisphaeraceae bacterium]
MSRAESNLSGQQAGTESQGAVGNVVQSLKDKAGDVAQSLRDVSGNVRDKAVEQYENLRGSAQEYYQQGKEKAAQWQDDVEQFVRDQPMKAVAIAAGVGVVLGFLFRRI